MTSNHKIKKIRIIIEKYDNDSKRVGDEIVLSVMSNGKKITLNDLYEIVVEGFKKQEEFNNWVVDEFKNIKSNITKLKKNNNLK